MASPMTSNGYNDLVTNVDILFQAQLENFHKEYVSTMYEEQARKKGDPKKMTFSTLALPTYARRSGELSRPQQGSAILGTSLDKELFKFAFTYDYTIEMDEFDTERLVDQFANNLSMQIKASEELEEVHQLLTYANSSTYVPMGGTTAVSIATPDGQPVGSASHTVPGISGTKSNILANAAPLTADSLTLLIKQLQKETVNDEGRNIIMDIDTLIIPENFEMEKRAFEILGSSNTPFEMSNTANVFKGGSISDGQGGRKSMNVVRMKRGAFNSEGNWDDTKAYYWGVCDSKLQKLSNKVAYGTHAVIKTPPTAKSPALFGVTGYGFTARAVVYWQGKGFSFATSL